MAKCRWTYRWAFSLVKHLHHVLILWMSSFSWKWHRIRFVNILGHYSLFIIVKSNWNFFAKVSADIYMKTCLQAKIQPPPPSMIWPECNSYEIICYLVWRWFQNLSYKQLHNDEVLTSLWLFLGWMKTPEKVMKVCFVICFFSSFTKRESFFVIKEDSIFSIYFVILLSQ